MIIKRMDFFHYSASVFTSDIPCPYEMKFSYLFAVAIVFLTFVSYSNERPRSTKKPNVPATTPVPGGDPAAATVPAAAVTVPAPQPAPTVPAPAAPVTDPPAAAPATVPAPATDPPAAAPATVPAAAAATVPATDPASATVPSRSVDDPNADALANSAAVVGGSKVDPAALAASAPGVNSTVAEEEMEKIWSVASDVKVAKGARIPTQRLGQTRFVVFRKRANWFRSHEHCRRYGMNLATLPTEQVYEEVVKIIFDMSVFDLEAKAEWLGGRRYWIGLNDLSGEGDWRWVDTGDRLNYTSKWYEKPNHPGEEEHCGVLWNPNFEKGKHHSLDDATCTGIKRGYYFICEHYKDVPRNY